MLPIAKPGGSAGQTLIKICGVTRPEDAVAAAKAGANAVGLIFAERSRRFVTLQQAREVRSSLPPGVLAVGVFVDEQPSRIADISAVLALDVIQLHGTESPEQVLRLRELLPPFRDGQRSRIAKALAVSGPAFAEQIRRWASALDGVAEFSGFLLDRPAENRQGTSTLDWAMMARVVGMGGLQGLKLPLGLAGGLTPANVADAIRTLRPDVVDVAGGVEFAPGRKDAEFMTAFCRAVHDTSRRLSQIIPSLSHTAAAAHSNTAADRGD